MMYPMEQIIDLLQQASNAQLITEFDDRVIGRYDCAYVLGLSDEEAGAWIKRIIMDAVRIGIGDREETLARWLQTGKYGGG